MLPNLSMEMIADHFFKAIKPSPEYIRGAAVSCKDDNLLVPVFKETVNQMIDKAEADHGIVVKRLETFRTNALQAYYYSIGNSKIRANGMHHYGTAWDLGCLDGHGDLIEQGSDKAFKSLRKTALEFGIHLLPEWDAGHMQAVATSEQNALRSFILNYRATEFKGLILMYGVENHYVAALKQALVKLGFYPQGYDTKSDYFFGVTTEESVIKFQKARELTPDGIVGKNTITALKGLGFDITS